MQTPDEVNNALSQHATALLDMQLSTGQDVVIRVEGHSMGALLSPHAEIKVCSVSAPVKNGDIILLRQGESYVAHRIVRQTPEGLLITKGDGWFNLDTPVSITAVCGKVVGIKYGDVIYTPWHWRRPWSRFIGLLSLFEGMIWPHFNYPLRVIHRTWRFAWRRNHSQED